ncbi:HesA/MoeB/ThiF family protein [Candidatus Thorarchaeota archaeon]|nr:MAG: HesA/MoeB/ThiF family protein [Candidatus Thorarchaeota archaeon]
MINLVLTSDQRTRYSRMLALPNVDEQAMKSILDTHVTVVGAGGLGSPILRLLTAIGFGTIRVIDHDIVDLSNLQRQTIYNTDDIGTPKAETAVSNLAPMNPDVVFEPYSVTIREDNASDLLGGTDIILDGLDSIKARRAVNRASQELHIPYVYAGAIQHYANISTFIPGETGCLHCLLGDTQDTSEMTCENVGVTPTILSLAASIEVQEAIMISTQKEPSLANHLLHMDINQLSFDRFAIHRNEDCPVCSKKLSKEPAEEDDFMVTILCTGSFSISPPTRRKIDFNAVAKKLPAAYKSVVTEAFLKIIKDDGITITLLPKGNAVVEGVTSAKQALHDYKQILDV